MNSKTLLFPFLLVFFEMVTYLSNDMALPAMPAMMRDLSITAHETQWTLTSWFLGAISVQLLLGPLSDHFGRKSTLCVGGVLFVISTLVCALTHDYQVLLIARFIEGTGICFISVPGYASVHESFDQIRAIKILALMGSISILAPALGPIFGSLVLLYADWRWIFGFLVVWSAISVLLLFLWMPETLPENKRSPLKLLPALLCYLRILSHKEFVRISFILGFIFCGFILWIASGPFLVIDHFHYSPTIFGFIQGVIFLSYIFANHWVKYLIDRHSINKIVRIGIIICALASVFAFVTSLAFANLLYPLVIALTIFSFGSGLVSAPLNRLAIESSNETMGARMAIFSTIITGFATLGSILVSVFYNGTLISISSILLFLMLLAVIFHFFRN